MPCRDIQFQIPSLLLDDLPVAEREATRTHCRECAECGTELKRLSTALNRFSAVPERAASAQRREAAVAAMLAVTTPQAPPTRRAPAAEVERGASAPLSGTGGRPVSGRRRLRLLWLTLPLTAAAGLMLAVFSRGPESSADRAPFAFRVTDRVGVVEVQRPGQSRWEQARKDEVLGPGDRLRTARHGFAVIDDPVKGRLTLNADTCISLVPALPDSRDDTITLLRGECWSELHHRETGRLFFEAPDGNRIEVVGTKFNVRYR
ncbi:MAG: FecR domain-containing protein [Planctomycetes bacterium]|nr:FecR domain-containing protein [Planctomycetota bacterium]